MVQADIATLRAKILTCRECLFEGFTGDETPGESVLHTSPGDAVGDTALRGQPKDEISDKHLGLTVCGSSRQRIRVEMQGVNTNCDARYRTQVQTVEPVMGSRRPVP